MDTSVIRYRVADFLKTHAPFDALPGERLIELAGKGRVKFHSSEEFVFRQGQAKTAWVWVVQQGRVELLDESSGAGQLRDVLGEGDLLGLDRFLGSGAYLFSARTATDVILYAIEAAAFEDLAARYPVVQRYLGAHFSVLGAAAGRRSWLDAEAPGIEFVQARTSREPNANYPSIETPFTTRGAVRRMVATHSEALAVGPNAVLTASDLALFCDRNPARLLRMIREASSVQELAPLLRQTNRMVVDGLAQASDVDDCAAIATEMAAAAASACIRFAHQDAISAGIEPPAERFCWLAFGTLARGEVLRLAPPAVGVVYEDGEPESGALAGAYFNAVAGQVGAWFHACGLEGTGPTWPEGVHPCLPLSEWSRFFTALIRTPFGQGLFLRRELFDLRALDGEAALLTEVIGHIGRELNEAGILVPLMANDTLHHLPPMTVFHGLVLDNDGSERATLDLSAFMIDPISDAARVFALASRGEAINTLQRLEAASRQFPEDTAIFQDAAEAFRFALYQRALAGSPSIELAALGKLDQRAMKTAFASILRLLELTSSRFFMSL
jgi:signal-transduction protein with cAMP-binding, CBS, and nucleotidyltransferase domain